MKYDRALARAAGGTADPAATLDAVARTCYWPFLRRYDLPLSAHRAGVDEARAELARLERRVR